MRQLVRLQEGKTAKIKDIPGFLAKCISSKVCFYVFFTEMFSLFLTGRFVKAPTPWSTSSLMKSLSVPSSMTTGKSEIEIFSDWNKRFPVRWEKMISSVSHKSHVWLTSRLPLYLWFQVNMTASQLWWGLKGTVCRMTETRTVTSSLTSSWRNCWGPTWRAATCFIFQSPSRYTVRVSLLVNFKFLLSGFLLQPSDEKWEANPGVDEGVLQPVPERPAEFPCC